MTKNITKKIITACCFFAIGVSFAQSPVNGFMQKAGEGGLSLTYSYESYDKVFLVPEEVNGVPVFNDVSKTSISLYGDIGISDNLNIVLNVPYIQAEGNATDATLANNGFENERSGIQDLKVYVKYRFHSFKLGENTLDFIGSVGLETPLGDYSADEGLQSIIAIGNEASSFNTFGIATFKTKSGLFTTGQVGYSFRGNSVPDALISELKLGYACSKFYLDAFIANQLSEKDGVDILGEGFTGFFPATRVNYTRVGVNGYVPFFDGIGLTAGANTYIAGRNIGKSTGFYGGLVYSF
ncbi:hypothetical protein BWZ20_06735 [Winogradskyella sp. J14-2]|uniref:hypothetical protein n=1 Tax=Winogradskyella sp. J14-2 TaxID=1936080 RepID=UPI000972B6D1|nr:hypothetical protein [Winogradskyella sp. J14-2]APY09616.1 hypothetical protein BWZ20_06735 [Winogradskyella sp. J14-2]